MKLIATAVLTLAFTAGVMAEVPNTSPSKGVPAKSEALTKEDLLEIENLSLKEALLAQQKQALDEQKNAFVQRRCGAARIDPQYCVIDTQGKMIRENLPPVAAKK